MQLDFELCGRLIAAAARLAREEYKRPVCLALYDASRTLLAFARMDGAPARCVPIAQAKAFTSIYMESDTADFGARLEREKLLAGDFGASGLTAMPGGVILKNDRGEILGALGVSGLTPREDAALGLTLAALCREGPNITPQS